MSISNTGSALDAITSYLSKAMLDFVLRYSYDDMWYIARFFDDDSAPSFDHDYFSDATLEANAGGDCAQLSMGFVDQHVSSSSLSWSWLGSTDASYRASPVSTLVPYQSLAIGCQPFGQEGLWLLGVALGHTAPIPIVTGTQRVFWEKRYVVEDSPAGLFRLRTLGKDINRYRDYSIIPAIDFQPLWRRSVRAKEDYSIVRYAKGRRHYLGYKVREKRFYYTLGTDHIQIANFDKFMRVWSSRTENPAFATPHLPATLAALEKHGDELRTMLRSPYSHEA